MKSSVVNISGGAPGPQGPTGPTGPAGTNGTNGYTLLSGVVDPSSGIGVDGDFYINTNAKTIFGPKTGGVWSSGISIIGPQGATGATGSAGPEGPEGPQGPQGESGTNGTNGVDGRTILYGVVNPTTEGVDGDFYINTSTNYIYGPKASGVWPSGTALVGPQGEPGLDGTYRDVTISTDSPTGTPTTGALWFQVEA